MISPELRERLDIMETILRHGHEGALERVTHDGATWRAADEWLHARDEFKWLRSTLEKDDER